MLGLLVGRSLCGAIRYSFRTWEVRGRATASGNPVARRNPRPYRDHGTTPPTADPDCRISNWWRSVRSYWNDFANLS
jgi:hypothetical protein